MLVQLSGVSKSFGSQIVLRDVSLQIHPSDKIGLIGANGAGKTTLLKIIRRSLEADSGAVTCKAGLQIGKLDQIPEFPPGATILEEGLHASSHLQEIEAEMRAFEHAIAAESSPERLNRYAHLQHQFELLGGYSYRARTEAALQGVGFSRESLSRPSSQLSGGEKNRLALAKLLLSDANLLLLDEPTNHLDIRSIEWLETFLKETDKAVMVVSHDRFFLDRVVDRIVEVADCRTTDYRGNYSAYLKERAERQDRLEKEWRLQNEWIEKQEDYVRRNIAGQKTKQAQSRRKLLSRVQRIEKPQKVSSRATFRFLPAERSGRHVLSAHSLNIGYGQEPLVRDIELQIERGQRWAILGGNGSGKTTLLRTLIGQLSPLDGDLEWSDALEVGYYDQQLQDLNPTASVLDEIRAMDSAVTDGELRGYLAQFLFSGDDAFKKVSQLSGGESSRLMLAKIIYARPQLLALDEPTNHLDIAAREALEIALAEYPGTIVFVTHDRYLVQKIATNLLYIEQGRPHIFDRLSAFEEWLSAPQALPTRLAPKAAPAAGETTSVRLSKNQKERLKKEAAELEDRIAAAEKELADLEASFQSPASEMDWEAAHRRYAGLKTDLESFYQELANRWEILS